MKTIEVSDEVYEKLIAVSNELNAQYHDYLGMSYIAQVRPDMELVIGFIRGLTGSNMPE